MAAGREASLAEVLQALVVIARLHHVSCDAAALLHRLGRSGNDPAAVEDLLLVAKQLGLRAKHARTALDRLPLTPLPALALLRDGSIAVLAQCDGQRVLLQRFAEGAEQRPLIEPLAAFAEQWAGELILITSRASLAGELAKFDFSWFIPSLVKHR